ncbi:MAG: glycosyltransferase [Lachnospiraceae bacterium]|nr:glycosyltransferase [Lachnospiraceae bacterium]
MVTISLCMIVKDEEKRLGQCLKSIKDIVDQIVIVDTGSTDHTKEIATEYTTDVYDFKWIDDFAAARNYSFSKAECDYILWLDADDILLTDDADKLKELKERLGPDVDGVTFLYHYAFDEEKKPTLVFRRTRLIKREKNYKWKGFIHEYIDVNGKVIDENIIVTHTRDHGDSDRNLNLYIKKKKEGVLFNSRDQYYYAKEIYYHGKLEEAIRELTKSTTMDLWMEDKLDAYYCIADCYQWQGEYKKAREAVYPCFELATPRAEGLYRLAKAFQEEKNYASAIYWYESIFGLKKPDTSGFIFEEYWTWKPHLELCCCYYGINEVKKAILHNEKAAEFKPNDGAVQYNREFFKSLEDKKA